jgi:hypothetical protein
VQPLLIVQELQTIKVEQHNINYINQIRFIKLLHDDYHKQAVLIYESNNNLNRCTPCRGKPDQHATRFPCPVRVWTSTIHISYGPHIEIFHEVIDGVGQSYCSREKGDPDYIPSMVADRFVGPHLISLSLTTIEQWGKPQNCQQYAIRLIRPIYHHAIGTSILTHESQPIGP